MRLATIVSKEENDQVMKQIQDSGNRYIKHSIKTYNFTPNRCFDRFYRQFLVGWHEIRKRPFVLDGC